MNVDKSILYDVDKGLYVVFGDSDQFCSMLRTRERERERGLTRCSADVNLAMSVYGTMAQQQPHCRDVIIILWTNIISRGPPLQGDFALCASQMITEHQSFYLFYFFIFIKKKTK